MSAETMFHLIMLSLIGACVLGCGIAGLCELFTNDEDYSRIRRHKRARRNMQRRARRAAEMRARYR
jgi:hypothetical protein